MDIKVLVIEDNIKFNRKICELLQSESYIVLSALSIKEANRIISMETPQIVLLDIMLPDGKGYSIIRQLKNKDSWVIMLTALSDIDSKILCYEYGADDYITKPFDLFELIFKVNAVKKILVKGLKHYIIGDIAINENTCELIKDTKVLIVPASHIRLIKKLYEKYLIGDYLSKLEIQSDNLSDLIDDNRIQTFVSRVRKDLKHLNSEKVFIETIYGKGYSLDIIDKKRSNNA